MDTSIALRRRDRRGAVAVVTAFAVFMAFAIAFVRPWGSEPSRARDVDSFLSGVAMASDFVSFWTGASLLRDGAGPDLYDMERQQDFQVGLRRSRFTGEKLVNRLDPYHNPPPLALLFLPLALLPLSWAFACWTILSGTAFAVAVALPLRRALVSWTPVSVMMATGVVADALIWGQADALFVLSLSLALLSFTAGRPFLGGMLLGMLWLKPQYALVFPLVFLIKRRWHELAGMAVAGVALAAVSLVLVGVDGALAYLSVLRQAGAFYPPESSFIFPELMVNWRAVVANSMPGIGGDVGSALTLALWGATLLVSLMAWRGEYDPRGRAFPLQMLITVLAAVLGSPHSHLHGVSLLFPPLALGLARGSWKALPRSLWGGLWVSGFVLSWLAWEYVPLRWLLAPYFLVAMAVLLGWSLVSRTRVLRVEA